MCRCCHQVETFSPLMFELFLVLRISRFLFSVDQRSSNSSSNIFKLLIDEQPMTSKYWTTNKSSVKKASLDEQREAIIETDNNTSCGESIEEDIVTIKSTNLESRNNDANVQNQQPEPKSFTMSDNSTSIKRRPDSLKLSFGYGTDNLAKSATSTVDVNQSKSMSVASNKSHNGSKKSTSYDLWVNENAETKESNRNSSLGEKKLDVPGRVSFR